MADLALNIIAKMQDMASPVAKGMMGNISSMGKDMAVGIAIAGTALVAAGVASVKMAGDFQSSMTGLVTGAGESAANIGMVSDGILAMAPAVGTTTKQLADGMFMIESSGQHGAQALDTLSKSAMAAKVGNADLGVVANAVTTEMTDYASSNLTAAQAANMLIATVANGKTHMQDLGSAMANILPTASAAGVSLVDVSAAMSTMTGEGIPAAQASTYLRQTIMAMENPSSKAAAAMKSVGLSASDLAAEMKKSLPDALAMITDAVGNKFPAGSQEYIAAIASIVGGTKSMQGILDLTGDHLTTFKNNVTSIGGAVKAGGNSIVGWTAVQGDFNQKMDQARASLETLGIKIGTALLPVLSKLLTTFASPGFQQFATTVASVVTVALTGLVNALVGIVTVGANVIAFFAQNQAALTTLKVVLIPIAGAIVAVLVVAFYTWAVAAGAAAIATLAATWPILAIGAVIAAVVAGIILAVQHWGAICAWIQGVWAVIVSFFQGLWNGIIKIFVVIGQWFHDRFLEAYNAVTGVFASIGGWFAARWADITRVFASIGGWFGTQFTGAVNAVKNAFSGIGSFFQGVWSGVVGIVKGAINWVISGLDGMIRFINGLGIHLPAVWAGPVQVLPQIDISFPQLPTIPLLATGGTVRMGGLAVVGDVPEFVSKPMLANLPAGARVTPLSAMGGGAPGSGGGGTITNNITIHAGAADAQALYQIVLKELTRDLRRSGNLVTMTSGGRS